MPVEVVEEVVEETVAPAKENTPSSGPKKTFWQKIKFDKWKGWVYLLPCLILILIFTVWPIINTVATAFTEEYPDFYDPRTGNVGLYNFKHVLDWGDFGTCLKNTVLLCVLTVPLSTLLALLIAVALNSIKPLQKFFQTVFFLPYVTNSIAIGMVFATMFQMIGSGYGQDSALIDSYGLVNTVLGWFGVEPINWMNAGSEYWANMTVMVIYIVWNALPFKILILLGGLQSVNKQYYEAARIDSTPKWRVFLRITVPLLSPMLAYVIITGFIGGFKEYSSIVGVFGDDMSPSITDPGRLNTMVGFIYDSLGTQNFGWASAGALILFLIIFVVTMINLQVSKKNTHY